MVGCCHASHAQHPTKSARAPRTRTARVADARHERPLRLARPSNGRCGDSYLWFLRGFTNSDSLDSAFAFLSARFCRIDFPCFFTPALLSDFPDNGITTFHSDTHYHTHLKYLIQSGPRRRAARQGARRNCFKFGTGYDCELYLLVFVSIVPVRGGGLLCLRSGNAVPR